MSHEISLTLMYLFGLAQGLAIAWLFLRQKMYWRGVQDGMGKRIDQAEKTTKAATRETP